MAANDRRSKRQSAASSRSRQRESIVLFVDRSLGKELATSLREASANVIVHDDMFAPTTPDAEWLEKAGRERWVVL